MRGTHATPEQERLYKMIARSVPSNESGEQVGQTVERARSNPAAFEPLYREYFPRIYRYCLRRVSCPQEAEDLTSLVFTRALANLSTFRGDSFAAWLFRIAHNAVVNHLRSRRPTVPLEQAAAAAHSGETLLAGLLNAEEREQVARRIATLPDDQRELLTLKVAGGLSAKEIGQVVGKSETAVRMALSRIVQRLRAALAEEAAR